MDRLEACLDELDKVEGPACLVTFSKSKFFGTGFDLATFKHDASLVVTHFQNIIGRILTLPMATMCVINAHAIAGGLLIALAHDFRIMTTNPKVILCMSEIDLGIPFPIPISVLLR